MSYLMDGHTGFAVVPSVGTIFKAGFVKPWPHSAVLLLGLESFSEVPIQGKELNLRF